MTSHVVLRAQQEARRVGGVAHAALALIGRDRLRPRAVRHAQRDVGARVAELVGDVEGDQLDPQLLGDAAPAPPRQVDEAVGAVEAVVRVGDRDHRRLESGRPRAGGHQIETDLFRDGHALLLDEARDQRGALAQKNLDLGLARLVGHSSFAHEPPWFTTAPVSAINRLHENLGWSPDDVDLYEINEAFAIVTMAAMRDVGIDHAKVNVNGGATALGHPIGASGARISVTLLSALRKGGLKRGIASLCIGGGEATALAFELL